MLPEKGCSMRAITSETSLYPKGALRHRKWGQAPIRFDAKRLTKV